jgi:hypothetical protein
VDLEDASMAPASPAGGHAGLLRILTIVVLVTMLGGVLYAAWISVVNFSRIGV